VVGHGPGQPKSPSINSAATDEEVYVCSVVHTFTAVYYRVDDMFIDDLQRTFLLTGLRYQSQLWI
jgi:hypothetical protein